MEFTKKLATLLYLDKNGFYFYQEGLPNVVSMAFTEDSVKDMDIINSATIDAQIQAFVQQYQVKPGLITIVLSPHITFEKDILEPASPEREAEAKKFVDTIPFESVLSKEYPIEKGIKVLGCNAEMYTELAASFQKTGTSVEHIIPYQLLSTDQTLIQNLTPENAVLFLKHMERLKPLSMISINNQKAQSPQPTQSNASSTTTEKPKKNNIRLFVMGGIFLVLFIILGFMIMNME